MAAVLYGRSHLYDQLGLGVNLMGAGGMSKGRWGSILPGIVSLFCPPPAGMCFADVPFLYPDAIVLGVTINGRVCLNPPLEYRWVLTR